MRGIDDLFTVYYSVTDYTAGDGALPTTTLRSVQGLMRHEIVGQMLLFRQRSRLANYLQSAIESSTSSSRQFRRKNGEAAPVTSSVNNSPKDMRRAYNSVGISDGNADCPARRPLPINSEYQFQVARFQAEMMAIASIRLLILISIVVALETSLLAAETVRGPSWSFA